MIELLEWVGANWAIFVAVSGAIGGMFKIYYDHLAMKRELSSYQNTTTTALSALQKSKEDRHKEVEQKFKEQERMTTLEIKNAKLENEKQLNEYRQQNDKRMEEQNKLIQQLLMNTNEIGTNVKFIFDTMNEIKENQKDNQAFREQFYRDQANKKNK